MRVTGAKVYEELASLLESKPGPVQGGSPEQVQVISAEVLPVSYGGLQAERDMLLHSLTQLLLRRVP